MNEQKFNLLHLVINFQNIFQRTMKQIYDYITDS